MDVFNKVFDKTGTQILEGDLLKVHHYGQGTQKRYYYLVVVNEQINTTSFLSVRDYNSQYPHGRLYVMSDHQRVVQHAKIVYRMDDRTRRERIKPYNFKK